MITSESLPSCPVEITLSLIDDRRKVLIIRELQMIEEYGIKDMNDVHEFYEDVDRRNDTSGPRRRA